jgi:hypothetical protein
MNIIVVSEYLIKDKLFLNHRQPDEPWGFINYISNNTDYSVFVLCPYKSYETSKVEVFDLALNKEIEFSLENADYMYFSYLSHLGENIKQFIKFVDFLNSLNLDTEYFNSLSAMKSNVSKQYLLTLQENTNLPISPTENVKSLDKLNSIAEASKHKMLLKPIVSERANGVKILQDMTEDEKSEYIKRYVYEDGPLTNSVLCQKFNKDFLKYGEKKIAVINGEVSIARRTVPPKDISKEQIVTTSYGCVMEKYKPTDIEIKLCKEVYKEFTKYYPALYIRVDLVGTGEDVLISEIECINPDYITCYGLHEQVDYDDLYEKLLLPLKK